MANYIPKEDPYIFLSWLNMKLRDECKDLGQLIERYNLSEKDIINKIDPIGYAYDKKINQFVTK
ncbi:DUF4250 domain-containing protein [Defluviitalea phaphyphila]|uniref:DUF4250 domain-containing protein n=1 Tax=Defluviitalea phaphyphila TaxID=1473580 RepID=UPI00072FC3B0|nr:DUF4250 domain-containing protein [Defluviitalea phaphyphila]